MLVSIICDSHQIIYENAIMCGVSTHDGLKSIFQFHKNTSLYLPAGKLFVAYENEYAIHEIGEAIFSKKSENVYLITNIVSGAKENIIDKTVQDTWHQIKVEYDQYRNQYNKLIQESGNQSEYSHEDKLNTQFMQTEKSFDRIDWLKEHIDKINQFEENIQAIKKIIKQ